MLPLSFELAGLQAKRTLAQQSNDECSNKGDLEMRNLSIFCGAVFMALSGMGNTAPIPLSKFFGMDFEGFGTPGGAGIQSIVPSQLHAAQITVTAPPGSTCDVRASIRIETPNARAYIRQYLFSIFVKAGTAPVSQTASHSFNSPIDIPGSVLPNGEWPNNLEVAIVGGSLGGTGTCHYSGVLILEKY